MEYLEPAQRESLTSRLNQVQASLSVSIGKEGKRYFHLRLSSVCAWAQAPISQAWWGTWVTWIKKTTWVISHNINWGFQSAGAHLRPCVICKRSTTFYCPFGSCSIIIISRTMHFSYIKYLIWSAKQHFRDREFERGSLWPQTCRAQSFHLEMLRSLLKTLSTCFPKLSGHRSLLLK